MSARIAEGKIGRSRFASALGAHVFVACVPRLAEVLVSFCIVGVAGSLCVFVRTHPLKTDMSFSIVLSALLAVLRLSRGAPFCR